MRRLVKLLVLVGPCYAVHEVPNGSPWTGTPVALPGWEGDTWTNSFKFGTGAREKAASLKLKGIELHVGHPWRAPADGSGASSRDARASGPSPRQEPPRHLQDLSGRTQNGTILRPRHPGGRAPRGPRGDQKGGQKGVQKGLRLHEPDEYLEPKWLRYSLPRVVTCISSGQPLDRPLAKS